MGLSLYLSLSRARVLSLSLARSLSLSLSLALSSSLSLFFDLSLFLDLSLSHQQHKANILGERRHWRNRCHCLTLLYRLSWSMARLQFVNTC